MQSLRLLAAYPAAFGGTLCALGIDASIDVKGQVVVVAGRPVMGRSCVRASFYQAKLHKVV